MNRIIDFECKQGYHVWIKFDDGFEGVINLEQFLGKGIAAELLEWNKFNTMGMIFALIIYENC